MPRYQMLKEALHGGANLPPVDLDFMTKIEELAKALADVGLHAYRLTQSHEDWHQYRLRIAEGLIEAGYGKEGMDEKD